MKNARANSQTPAGGAMREVGLAIGLFLLAPLVGGVSYFVAVLKYARVDPDIRLLRDEEFPQKLSLEYKPLTGGQLVVRGDSAVQPFEMIKQLSSGDAGVQRQIGISWSGVQPGDRLRVTFRNGFWTATKDLAVPPLPRPVANAAQPPTI